MNQIPNIEEAELIKFITDIVWESTDGGVKMTPSQFSHFEEPIGALTDFQKYLHQQLQKARHDWIREEIVKLEAAKYDEPRGYRGKAFNEVMQAIIDRYHSELDQTNT